MKPESGSTVSTWTDTADVPMFGTLDSDAQADVCIIGAGIAGLTTAYLLTKKGMSVVVIDDGPIGGGETQRTTAHLSNVIDDRFQTIKKEHSTEWAKLAYESHSAAIDKIEENIRELNIDCEFSRLPGFLFAGKQRHRSELEKEFAVCKEIGFEGVEMLETVPLPFFPEPRVAIKFPNQGQFHVLKYLSGIARGVLRNGGSIYSGVHADQIKDGEIVSVRTRSGSTIKAKYVVVATNSPVSDWVKIHTKQAAYRTYVIAGKIPAGSFEKGLYWDTLEPYHYIRCQTIEGDSENELLIIGGEDHRTGEDKNPEQHHRKLEEWAKEFFPMMKSVDYRWSGQVLETLDGLAFIGRDPAHGKNVFIATGDSGMGMTHGTISGMLLTDLITGVDNPWAKIYNPSRIPVMAAGEYLSENLNTAVQYSGWLKPSEARSISEIECGEGAIMRHEGQIVAAYRDKQCDKVSQCSAVCKHLGAIVQWNPLEKSWDCPAHGSRYKGTGEVINGPANSDLDKIADDKRIKEDHEVERAELPPSPPGDSGIQPPKS
jgi:glycine/D-amino acid oxidase-like deaminating enzyme